MYDPCDLCPHCPAGPDDPLVPEPCQDCYWYVAFEEYVPARVPEHPET